MANEVMVWDLETVPDLEGYARANDLVGRSPEEIRAAIGPDFPKLIYHSIVCIGALVASRTSSGYEVQVVGAPHVEQRTEKELIESFVGKVGQVSPQLITFYITFDDFLTVGKCRLAWRYRDDIGVIFERWLDIRQGIRSIEYSDLPSTNDRMGKA